MMFFRRAAARALSTSSRQICAPCRPQPTALLTSSLRLSASRPSTLVLFQKRCNSSAFSDAHDESPGAETTSSEASSGSVFEEMSESDGTEASQEGMTGRIHRLRGDTGRGASRNEPPPDPNPSVYIGNLYFSISELDLEKQMSKFGPLKHIKLLYDARGMSRGIAFANFETTEAAGRAVREMNGRFFEGRPVSVQYARNQEQRDVPKAARHPPSSTLFVGNLSYELTDKDLNDLFATIPNCTDVRVAIDRRTGQPRGFAHADFTDVESAVSAQEELNGKIMFGRRLRVDYTKRKDQMNEAPDHPEGESSEQLMG
ncbi:MAG: hypothetical protein M1823_003802 [Watsoniomyces obsoletus]|nr:MAG: hypothetical protein M1823_003802 [Watsoniomyces obsoletus]